MENATHSQYQGPGSKGEESIRTWAQHFQAVPVPNPDLPATLYIMMLLHFTTRKPLILNIFLFLFKGQRERTGKAQNAGVGAADSLSSGYPLKGD